MFPLVTALPSTHSAARLGALFAGFFGTMAMSDCSGPCITGVERYSSRCGPPGPSVASPELSRFPRTERARMLGVLDRAEPEKHSRWRPPRCCLPLAHKRRRSGLTAFAAQWPAYVFPYRLLVCPLTARGRGGSLGLPRNGLAPYTPNRSPGKSGRSVTRRGHRALLKVIAWPPEESREMLGEIAKVR